jgi:hypothetical protein
MVRDDTTQLLDVTPRSRRREIDPSVLILTRVPGNHASRLAALVERLELDVAAIGDARTEGDALADAVGGDHDGGDLALRWRIAVVRAVIAAPPDGDAVREVYGELVDLYRGDAVRLAQLRPLGDEIRRLEADGTLPSALVARSDRRPRR